MNYDSKEYKLNGDYTFRVSWAEECVSQKGKGNEQIALELEVLVPNRAKLVKVFDYLVNTPETLWKISQFCEATGLVFENNKITAADCKGRSGRGRFVQGQPNQDGRRYLECKEYYPSQAGDVPPEPQAAANNTKDDNDDSIPF